jgi:hypothetical protein
MDAPLTFTAFADDTRIASGPLREVLRIVKPRTDERREETLLIFEDPSGRQVDFNLRGPLDEVLDREAPEPGRRGPGRPRLGVVSREVTLLPRHWAWLEGQRGGASASLRRLVDLAREHEPERERARRAMDAAGRFITAMAGDREGFEEAYRALYAGDGERFAAWTRSWPADVRDHARSLAAPAFGSSGARDS